MASLNDHLNKMREERMAREKARIEKLRELNLKKYNKPDTASNQRPSTVPVTKPTTTSNRFNRADVPKNNFHVNGTTKRHVTAPTTNSRKSIAYYSGNSKPLASTSKPNTTLNNIKVNTHEKTSTSTKRVDNDTKVTKVTQIITKPTENCAIGESSSKSDGKFINSIQNGAKGDVEKGTSELTRNFKIPVKCNPVSYSLNATSAPKDNKAMNKNTFGPKHDPKTRKSFVPKPMPLNPISTMSRKSLQPPKVTQSASKVNPNRQSVFERLYQPKAATKKPVTDAERLRTDPDFKKQVIKNSGLIVNKRHTTFEPRRVEPPVRRSISAVHFKRIGKNELGNCIHKWSSIGDKLDKVHLKDVNEDASIKEDKIISAVKSERKRVTFLTPVPNFNTPRPEELQSRLQNWLQKRGKSMDSYHHLQCFGIHHLVKKDLKPLNLESDKSEYDDENKENQPLDSDSDNESFDNNMNNKEIANKDNWRRLEESYVSDCVDINESVDTTLTSMGNMGMHHVDELLIGALNDLTELLHEGFDWEQCARWLRAIRERFPLAPESAQYWECRAALEERRGDLPASVQCWEEAIAKGTERSVVEANLDQLLDKFMQLKISPNSGKNKQPDPKMVDVKNVFKSTLIRFAVQQAKLRQSTEPVKYTVTPVRRSARLSAHWSGRRTPLVCTNLRQAGELGHDLTFVPNDKLHGTP